MLIIFQELIPSLFWLIINPNNEEVVRLLEETSNVLCKTDKKYCNRSEL